MGFVSPSYIKAFSLCCCKNLGNVVFTIESLPEVGDFICRYRLYAVTTFPDFRYGDILRVGKENTNKGMRHARLRHCQRIGLNSFASCFERNETKRNEWKSQVLF